MTTETIGLVVTVILALVGYFATYYYNLRLTKKQQELDLTNRRMNEFYGPLYISSETGRMSYEAILRKFGRKDSVFGEEGRPPTEAELVEWRLWVKHVFMPINEYNERLILEKAHLIREQVMPQCLLDFVTHVSSYKPLLQHWENGDFSNHAPIIDFPIAFDEYAATSYAELKAEQLRLIGTLQRRRA